jgi:hypothetical protein
VDPAVCSLDYRLKLIGRLPFFRHLSSEVIVEINRLFEDLRCRNGAGDLF